MILKILVVFSLCNVIPAEDSDDQQMIIALQEPQIFREPQIARKPQIVAVTCTRIGIPGYPVHYLQLIGTKWRLYKCKKFFVFNRQSCGCVFHFPVNIPAVPAMPYVVPEPETKTTTTTTTTTTTPLPLTQPPPPPPSPVTLPAIKEATTTTTTTTMIPTTTPTTTTTTATTTTTTLPTTTTYLMVKCKKIPNPNNPGKYREEITGHGLVDRRCPSGTIFRPETCECEIDTRPKKKKKGLCDGCRFDRGVGYNEHFNRCDKYIICYPDARNQSKLIGVIRQCDVGEYWDQELMTCISSVDAYCEFDPCSHNSALTSYLYEGNCRGYWICRYGVSIGQCCPEGHAYKSDIGCVPDISCTSTCKHAVIQRDRCDKRPVPGIPFLFEQMVVGHGFVRQKCALGTVYNQTECRCSFNNRQKLLPACSKVVEMNFTDSVTTTVDHRVHVAAVNVSHENGSACFYGDSALVIPRFSNAIIGKRLEIRIKYKMRPMYNNKPQALVYNGDCGPDASISVIVTPRRSVFGLMNDNNQTSTLEVSLNRENYGWKYARFSLDNEIMMLEENGQRKHKQFFGPVSKSICGLKIGWGKGFDSFKGCISQLSISFCPT